MEIPKVQTRTATAIKTATTEKMITAEINTTWTTTETTTGMVRTTYRGLSRSYFFHAPSWHVGLEVTRFIL